MATLEKAISIALKAHKGRRDKADNPYVLHPLRVMLSFKSKEEENERIVGVLHDTIEDSKDSEYEVTLDTLRKKGFSETVIEAVDSVTKRPEEEGDEDYPSFAKRAGQNPIGRRVKIADLLDNMDLTRLAELQDKDFRRLERYLEALRCLEKLEHRASKVSP